MMDVIRLNLHLALQLLYAQLSLSGSRIPLNHRHTQSFPSA